MVHSLEEVERSVLAYLCVSVTCSDLACIVDIASKEAILMAQLSGKPLVCPVLIGRLPDLHSLHALLKQAKNGEGGLALISGEAGIGKSRMVSEAKTYAAAHSFLLLQGNCFPADTSCPYAPLLDLLRALQTSSTGEPLVSSLASLARNIFPLLPELVPDQAFQLSNIEPEQEKRRIFA